MSTSPAQCLFGRRTKTTTPTTGNLLQPKYDVADDRQRKEERRHAAVVQANKSRRDLEPLHSDPPTVHSPLSLSVFVARFWLPVVSLESHSSLVCNPKQSKLLRVFFNGIFLRTLSLKPHVFV